MQTFVANVGVALKNVHCFGKHAFISDSSDDFRFCPWASVQINPSFEFSGHLPNLFFDGVGPVRKQDTGKSLSKALIFAEHGENMMCT